MESLYTYAVLLVLVLAIAVPYWWKVTRQRKKAASIRERNAKTGMLEPSTLHPRIDLLSCIGCASCVRVCPEDVLGIVDGRAAVVNGLRCVGHALCAEACPVGAITMGFGTPKQGMEIPYYDDHYETSVGNLFIVGELGGIGLIRNAFRQGTSAVEEIARRSSPDRNGLFDVAIVGAGPAGIASALAAREHNLRAVVLEQDELGGSVLHYPRNKLILTQPAELALYGKIKASELSKEDLLAIFTSIVRDFQLNVITGRKVEQVARVGDVFRLSTGAETYSAHHVVLALGRRGSPRKLGVPGEGLTKVAYRLIEAERYTGKNVLIVGGGDSAVEAAVGLSRQKGNRVTVSYRREEFVRLKEKNEERIKEGMKYNRLKVIFNSEVVEIKPDSVVVREKEKIMHSLPNDYVFIFAGGELPAEFLKKIGVKLRTEDVAEGRAA